ncbi:cytidine/deoxycytidylate deaminase family protein [Corchorus olitorius]|uniref:Cytidine/deoxycytidylate deaminase family protein n=1 Tax=Corchorus olitorius TaxID=93759 RepID=A0A1R3KP60_9ROSI|nr:cytidine/deoxycytidylate deaminase family protein [Corchorus olitorius]
MRIEACEFQDFDGDPSLRRSNRRYSTVGISLNLEVSLYSFSSSGLSVQFQVRWLNPKVPNFLLRNPFLIKFQNFGRGISFGGMRVMGCGECVLFFSRGKGTLEYIGYVWGILCSEEYVYQEK